MNEEKKVVQNNIDVPIKIKKDDDDKSIPDEEEVVEKEIVNEEVVNDGEKNNIKNSIDNSLFQQNNITTEDKEERIPIKKQVKINKINYYANKYKAQMPAWDIDTSDLKAKSIDKLDEIINRIEISIDTDAARDMYMEFPTRIAGLMEEVSQNINEATGKKLFHLGGYRKIVETHPKIIKTIDIIADRYELMDRVNPFYSLMYFMSSIALEVNNKNKEFHTNDIYEAMYLEAEKVRKLYEIKPVVNVKQNEIKTSTNQQQDDKKSIEKPIDANVKQEVLKTIKDKLEKVKEK